MNMKDTTILLIFLLSILGIAMGIAYTDGGIESSPNDNDTISVTDVEGAGSEIPDNESADGEIIIILEVEPDKTGI